MISDDQIDTETYGVSDLRDGFFDAMYVKSSPLSALELLEHCEDTLPAEFDKPSIFATGHFLPRQWHELRSIFKRVTTTRAGISLLKSFTAFYVAYVLCLVPLVRSWLGPYHYMMALSIIVNHPARPFGAQVDGTALTILGVACGLGWGAIGLLLSTSTLAAQAGYAGILALFLALFTATMALIRAFFIRFHQAVLSAGIAVIFTTLAQTSSREISWPKLLDYGIPWLLGQAIALVTNCLVFPDAGSRAIASTLHASFQVMQEALVIPKPRDNRLRRRLARAFVDLSQACRDMALDMTITRFRPADIVELRNLTQAVIRALLTLKTDTCLFEEPVAERDIIITVDGPASGAFEDAKSADLGPSEDNASRRAIEELRDPTKRMLSCMTEALQGCDAALMDQSGHRKYLGPLPDVSSSLLPLLTSLDQAKSAFDAVESKLLGSGQRLPDSSMQDSDVVQLFVFARHVREAAAAIESMVFKVQAMQESSDWPRLCLPSYPFWKAVYRTNAQVRHDRGGVTAGSYHVTFAEIAHLLDKIKSVEHKPIPRGDDEDKDVGLEVQGSHATMDAEADVAVTPKKNRLRYRIWRVLYRLQGFESRYAFKVCLVTTLLSVPGYLDQSKGWWDEYEAWWAVAVGWLALHPRVGGNVQDLVTRGLLAILGAAWSGAAYAAGNGNPYVMGAFAAVYMLPMLYRFTQSSHPRSGLIGCLSFTVISLRLQANGGGTSPALFALLKGIAFFVGVTAPGVVNWVLWPFVARHELRHAISSMMFFMSIIYRSVVARYVYFNEGKEPTPSEVQRSEMLEGRLREGFVRIRQLLAMTQKEMRLRAPFDPVPYSALADACERFFDYLVAVRQSTLFYNPDYIRDNPVAAEQLLSFRRDAVATILGNLYILAGALRSQRKVPRYLPSAAAARKRLLIKSAEVEEEMSKHARETDAEWHKRWSDMYRYSYNASLTGCVAQMEELEKYTKLIVGEQGYDLLKK
ncbi:fusaric acid resistance protein-like domain-containing protein [Hirsutella rhossiliensis]|uniref:Fusaric acid resistance protein-like domain-containing protein n=1 Tax=Hirsutella rhossiliensis TaxID=111463 RepID=A0A9P8SET2_9HYPO|nr:fusaric acid resistance protein-like domain-containing protein [Hirsutella rhossiliensis]KAH0958700.1 fusaric acid resistance protein-like domain-containing protein [Hirsutella rhossiliensis]